MTESDREAVILVGSFALGFVLTVAALNLVPSCFARSCHDEVFAADDAGRTCDIGAVSRIENVGGRALVHCICGGREADLQPPPESPQTRADAGAGDDLEGAGR